MALVGGLSVEVWRRIAQASPNEWLLVIGSDGEMLEERVAGGRFACGKVILLQDKSCIAVDESNLVRPREGDVSVG